MTELPTVRRLGILLPSSNTVMEPETALLLPSDGTVTAHFSRFRMVTVSERDESRQQFDLAPMLAAAELLADTEPDVILWAGTAASWLGFAHDERLCAAMTARTGIASLTAVQAINASLSARGVTRIGLVTPYVAALETAIIANYAAAGIETVGAIRGDMTRNVDFAAVPPAEIARMARDLGDLGAEAIIVMCTNLCGGPVEEAVTQELGIPLIDSARESIRAALGRVRIANRTAHPRPASNPNWAGCNQREVLDDRSCERSI